MHNGIGTHEHHVCMHTSYILQERLIDLSITRNIAIVTKSLVV
jgi:hypothetical protein